MKLPEILKKNMREKKRIVIIALIVLIAGGYYWYSKSKSAKTAVQYKTVTVERGNISASIAASGNVVVDQSANIDPTISGTVTNLSVNVGEKVRKGQLLFNIDNNDLSLAVTKAYSSYLSSLSSLESSKASKKEAKENLDNNTGGAQGKITLKQKLEAAEASVVTAQENVTYAQQSLRNERLNYAERNVTSPIDGTVNAINIKNGDDLSKLSSGSSRTVPIIIGDLNTMKAQVQVNEVDISNVNIGQKVSMTFSAIDGLEMSGTVEKMDSLGTLSSGVVTYNVVIDFEKLDPRIKPEMSVSANIITETKNGAIIVPNSAVKTQGGNSYVEVMKNGNTPVQVAVKTGISNNIDTEIINGINLGDKVVTQTISSSTTSTNSSNGTGSTSRSNNRGGFGFPGMH